MFKKKHLKIILELFLYEMLSGIYVKIVGSVSLGDLMVFLIVPTILLRKNFFKQNPQIKTLSIIYSVYFLTQIVSEVVNQNAFSNSIKGFSITILSYSTVIYLIDRLGENIKLVLFILFFEALKLVIFINAPDITSTVFENDFTTSTFFKFRLTPIFTNIALIFSCFLLESKKKYLTILMLFVLVLVYVFFNARSASLGLFFTAIILTVDKWFLKNKKLIPLIFIFLIVISYGSYALWVSKSLNSAVGVGTNEQILRMSNPYNPFELLLQGRTEVVVGLIAFQDRFLWGFGSWPVDKGFKYYSILLFLKNGDMPDDFGANKEEEFIPSHSVLVGAGVINGIFSFLAMLVIFFFFLKKGIGLFIKMIPTPYIGILIFVLIEFIWTILFSPTGQFRQTLPLMFAIILVFSKQYGNYQTVSKTSMS